MRHELHLLGRGLRFWALAALVLAAVGWMVDGGRGVLSVGTGAGIVAVNHAIAASSTGWARTLRTKVVAVGYAVFVVRMIGVFAAFAALAGASWVHRELVAIAFCATLATTLTAECVSYVRKSYVPSWRLGVQR